MHRLHLCALLIAVCSLGLADETEWLRQLGSPDPQAGQAAVAHFAAQGAKAVPLLRQVLQSDDLLARQYAAAALARIGKPGADRVLMRLLITTEDELLRQFCAEALAARGKAAVPLLRDALLLNEPPAPFALPTEPEGLTDEEYEKLRQEKYAEACRTFAFDAVVNLPPSLAMPICADVVARPTGIYPDDAAKLYLLDQGVPGLRLWAKSYLSHTGLPDVDAVNRAWREADDDSDWDEYMETLGILPSMSYSPFETSLRSEDALAAVRRVVNEARRSRSATQRLWATQFIYFLSDKHEETLPTEPLLTALNDPCWAMPLAVLDNDGYFDWTERLALLPALRALTKHPCDPLRLATAEALAPSGDPAALEALRGLLAGPSKHNQEKAAEVIVFESDKWTDEQKLSFVKPLLDAHDTHEYSNTHNALILMPPAAWVEVAERSKTTDPIARADYLSIIGELRAKEAAPTILRALDDPDAQVRESALQALALVSPEDARPHLERLFNSGEPKAEQSAYLIARRADDPALLARIILAKPALAVPPLDDRAATIESDFGIPAVNHHYGEDEYRQPTIIPELLDAARRLFGDERQPERVRMMAAETILEAGLAALPDERGPGEVPTNVLPPELWPPLEFALLHFPRGINWGPNETDPIVDAAWLVREPAAVATLARVLRDLATVDDRGGPGMTTGELRKHIIVSLLSIKPQGEEAFWKTLEEGDPETQVRLLGEAVVPFDVKLLPPEKLDAAVLRLLQATLTDESLHGLTNIVQPGTPAAAGLAKALKAALTRSEQSSRQRSDVLWDLSRLKDPEVEALALQTLNQRMRLGRPSALSQLRQIKTPEARAALLAVANSDFELYGTRFSALETLKRHDASLAQDLATRWTRDPRYMVRYYGRMSLARDDDR